MPTLTIYAAKAMIYSAIFFGYYCLALRNKRFHYYNRFYLLMTVALSLLFPFFHFELWQWNSSHSQVIQLMNVAQTNESETVIKSKAFALNPFYFALIFYFFIALYLLLALVSSIAAIFWYKQKYSVQKIDNINFINTDLEQAPFSFFNNLFWKNTVRLTDDFGKQIFTHELTHIKQKHSWDKLFMRIVTALFWFNPAYWFIQKELALIHEFIADEKAIENKSAEAFALMILGSKYSKNIFSPAQSFYYSPIKRRLIMLTTSKKPSFSYARRMMVLPLLAISLFLFAFKLQNDAPHTTAIHTNAPFVLVVDAGHGGKESGAEWNNILEKDINLSIAKKMEALEPEYGITVRMTREEDRTVSLQDRMNFIKTIQPNAFVSIHINSSAGQETVRNGASIYIPKNEAKENYKQSELLGSVVLQNVGKDFTVDSNLLQLKSDGIYVIDANPYPAILVECGYLNNENDLKQLSDNAKTEQLARDILKGVVAYANADKNKENALQSISDTAKKLSHGYATAKEIVVEPSSDTMKKPAPLYIVEGKEMSEKEALRMDNKMFGVVNILSKAESVEQYGEKGKNGVITIQFKKDSAQQPVLYFASSEITNEKTDTITDPVQTPPSFPGVHEAWIKYLQQNLRTDILTKKKAPIGTYKVVVSFTVAEDGNVMNAKAENDPGYGTGAEAVRVIQHGPKWVPAQQDGKNVVAKTKQAITFEIADGR